MPCDMGQALIQSGFRVITFLGGGSDHAHSLSAGAGIEKLGMFDL